MNCWNFYGSITCHYNGAVEFGLITVTALLAFLDYLVAELEYHYLLKRADSLCDYLDYLDTVVSLEQIRASEEYRSIRSK
jgi:hypothetical protein